MNNIRQLEVGLTMQAAANGNYLPATNWCTAIQGSMGSPGAFLCPSGNPGDRCHFAMNAALAGVKLDDVKNPQTLVLVFEANGGWDVSGGKELLSWRHGNRVVVGFVDGHVEMVTPSRAAQLRWDP